MQNGAPSPGTYVRTVRNQMRISKSILTGLMKNVVTTLKVRIHSLRIKGEDHRRWRMRRMVEMTRMTFGLHVFAKMVHQVSTNQGQASLEQLVLSEINLYLFLF